MEKIISVLITELTPYDIRGSVTPVEGINFVTPPKFKNDWIIYIVANPKATYL